MPIYDSPRGWKIKGVKGYHRSKAAAERRLKAVKASQSESGDKPKSKSKRPGLWENIRAKRARGEKPARKGSKAYKSSVKAAKSINKAEKKGKK